MNMTPLFMVSMMHCPKDCIGLGNNGGARLVKLGPNFNDYALMISSHNRKSGEGFSYGCINIEPYPTNGSQLPK